MVELMHLCGRPPGVAQDDLLSVLTHDSYYRVLIAGGGVLAHVPRLLPIQAFLDISGSRGTCTSSRYFNALPVVGSDRGLFLSVTISF